MSKDETAEAKDVKVMGRGFCRICRVDVDIVPGKKDAPSCARCGGPRIDTPDSLSA